MTYVRRDVWTLLARDPWDDLTEAYARAVATMQARAATDPTSWAFQAAIHGSYAGPPPGATWSECQHSSWFFLPWHRMYLYFFERIVRAAIVGNGDDPRDEWALPYWNYDQPAPRKSLPKPLREPQLPGGIANPLFLQPPRRSAAIARGGQLSPLVTSPAAAMSVRAFVGPPGAGFGGGRSTPVVFGAAPGALEQTPHNVIHVQIGGRSLGTCNGGMMTDPNCAAQDPVFWMHHANIDRLWSRWIALGGPRANPVDSAWLRQTFTFYDETGMAVVMSCADVLDTAAQLSYVYDDAVTPPLRMPAPAPPPSGPGGPPEMVAASEQPISLAGQRVSVALTVPPAARARVPGGAAAAAAPATVYLNVEDIDAPGNPGIVYAVFLNAPLDASEAVRAEYHAGNVTLFGIESIRRNDRSRTVPGLRHTFEITGLVERQQAAGRWNPDAIHVTFEPVTPMAPDAPPGSLGMERATLSEELAQAREMPVRIGRVSLFVA